MKKTYRIYRLENKETADVLFKFYLPEEDVDIKTSLQRKAKRIKELYDLKRAEYIVSADLFANKEEYLNARLSVAVTDYCNYDHDERYVRIFRQKYSPEVYYQTLEMIIESKRATMKVIASLIRRLNREDLDIRSELALVLYDQYLKEISK